MIRQIRGSKRFVQPFSLFKWLSGEDPTTVLTVRLFTARNSNLSNPVIGDFTEADFPGYFRASFPPTSFTQFLDNGTAYLQFPTLFWPSSTAAYVGPNVRGLFSIAARADGSTFVVGWADFNSPVDVSNGGFVLIEQFAVTARELDNLPLRATMIRGLVLSLFPGADLLGRGFEEAGFCVVRGPDLLFGQRIEDFHPLPDVFEGIIGGPPCQDYSRPRRTLSTGRGDAAGVEYARCVTEARPEWFLAAHVTGVPTYEIEEFTVQRLNARAAEFGLNQSRLRCFQFGRRDQVGIALARVVSVPDNLAPCCMATEGTKQNRRDWRVFCMLQGLPADFDLPGWSLAAKYRAVGNGVPVPMAREIAIAIQRRRVTANVKVCLCDCGRPAEGKQIFAGPGCRKPHGTQAAKPTPGILSI